MFMPDEPTRVFRESDFPSHPADDRTQLFRRPTQRDMPRPAHPPVARPPEDTYPRDRQPRFRAALPYKDQELRPALPAGRSAVTPRSPGFKAASAWHWVLTITWRPPKSRDRKQSSFSGVFTARPGETRSDAFEGIVTDCLRQSSWDGPYSILFWSMSRNELD